MARQSWIRQWSHVLLRFGPGLGALALSTIMSPASLIAVEDLEGPSGSLTINGGATITNDINLHLDVPATDDVGVTIVRVRTGSGPWTEYPYAPELTYPIGDPAVLEPGSFTIHVEWEDGAGHIAPASAYIYVDWVPPSLDAVSADTTKRPGPIRVRVSVSNQPNGAEAAAFSSDGGAHWGAEVPVSGGYIYWDALDPTAGGSSLLGPRTFHVRVRDPAGNWSASRSAATFVVDTLTVQMPANAITGGSITLTPTWDHEVSLPGNASCMWDFAWGDDASINYAQPNETYGSVTTQGTSANGWCKPWTFTLPWTPVRRYLVSLRVTYPGEGSALGDFGAGGEVGTTAFNATVGSTSRLITSSNLPMFYAVPETGTLRVGEPATYRGYALGGATIKKTDHWGIAYENVPAVYPGSAVFTFYPKVSGNLLVCLYRDYSAGSQLTACYDPKVKPASGSSGTASSGGSTPAASSPPATDDPGATPEVSPPERSSSPDPLTAALPAVSPEPTAIAAPAETSPEPPDPESGPIARDSPAAGREASAWLLAALSLVAGGGVLGVAVAAGAGTSIRRRWGGR